MISKQRAAVCVARVLLFAYAMPALGILVTCYYGNGATCATRRRSLVSALVLIVARLFPVHGLARIEQLPHKTHPLEPFFLKVVLLLGAPAATRPLRSV